MESGLEMFLAISGLKTKSSVAGPALSNLWPSGMPKPRKLPSAKRDQGTMMNSIPLSEVRQEVEELLFFGSLKGVVILNLVMKYKLTWEQADELVRQVSAQVFSQDEPRQIEEMSYVQS
jgi:hypothetical protein